MKNAGPGAIGLGSSDVDMEICWQLRIRHELTVLSVIMEQQLHLAMNLNLLTKSGFLVSALLLSGGSFGRSLLHERFDRTCAAIGQDHRSDEYTYRKVGLPPRGVELADAALKVIDDATKSSKGDKEKFVEAICKVLIGNVEDEASQRKDEKDTSFIKANVRLGVGWAILIMGPSMPGSGKIDATAATQAARATWTYTRFIKPGKFTDSVEMRATEGILDARDAGHSEYRNKDRWRSVHYREAIAATRDPVYAGLDSSMDSTVDSMVRTPLGDQISSMQTPAKTLAGAEVKKLVLEALGALADKGS